MIRGLLVLVQFLFWLLVIRLVVRGIVSVFGRGAAPPRPAAPRSSPPRAIEDLVRDPVCQTHVPRSRATTAIVGGREEHFCSAACRDRALDAARRAS
jgi:YHS domain-containing protein